MRSFQVGRYSRALFPCLLVLLVFIRSDLFARGNPDSLQGLFLGDQGHHRPADRFRQIEPVLSFRGIHLKYTENLADLNPQNLSQYDFLMVYANIDNIGPEQAKAVQDFVAAGGGYVPVHCASFCFRNSDAMVALTGAQFLKHGTGTFRTRIVNSDHPIMKGFAGFESWDETYVHEKHNEDHRTVLSVREGGEQATGKTAEPWTWVREQGKGRVFYTAWGHDERTWSNPGFHELLERGIRWAAGQPVTVYPTGAKTGLKPFEFMEANLPNYLPGKAWGTQGDPVSQMQKPLPPEESLKHYVTPRGFELQLFAAEPDIRPALSMAWDERGRLWLCESSDYPNDKQEDGEGHDTIRICEDTDGDGRADKFTLFADKLSLPTSLTFANGGVIVQQPPHTLFLKDTDGDGRADVREVLFTGWSLYDTHAGPSNLRYGLDNHIWGMVGYSGFEGKVGGKDQNFRTGFLRFAPDGSTIEFLGANNNNTWGLGFSEEGLVFGSTANRNPSVFLPIPNRYYESVRGWAPPVQETIADTHLFHPVAEHIRQVDHHGGYTAAAGHALYTARTYPREYWNRTAFVAGPTGHLIGTFLIEPKGAGFASRSPLNLVASDDAWSAPIDGEVGPDGQVWFIDWYNYIVQHNPTPVGYERGKGNAYVTDLRDKTHCRIYGVVYTAGKPSPVLDLSKASPADLVATLKSDNMGWRLHAQRLLVERGKTDVESALLELVKDRGVDELGLNVGAIHALWTLKGLGLVDGKHAPEQQAVITALKHPSAGVRRNALEVMYRGGDAVAQVLESGALRDRDPQVRLEALLALADAPPSAEAGQAVYGFLQVPANAGDRWLVDAATAAAAKHDAAFLKVVIGSTQATGQAASKSSREPVNVVTNASFEEQDVNRPKGWRTSTYSGRAAFAVDDQVAHSGTHSVRITSQGGADASWTQDIAVKPGRRYRLTAWLKLDHLDKTTGLGAQLNLHQLQMQGKTDPITGTRDWTLVSSEFDSGGNSSLALNCLLGGWGFAKGTAWWDDISVVEIGAAGGTPPAGLSEAVGKVVSLVTRHYAERGPVDTVVDTLASLRGANESMAAYVLEGLTLGWPESHSPRLTDSDKAAMTALMNGLPPEMRDSLLVLADRWGQREVFGADVSRIVSDLSDQLASGDLPDARRVDVARRLLRLEDTKKIVDSIVGQIDLQSSSDLAVGLISSLSASRTDDTAKALLAKWNVLTPASRRAGIGVFLRRPEWTLAMLNGIRDGKIHRSELNASEWQLLNTSKDTRIQIRAGNLGDNGGSPDREKVFQEKLKALKLDGDVKRGQELFGLVCAQCHTLEGKGGKVGPILTGIGLRPAPDILVEIIDPNRSLEANFRLWSIDTKDGESYAGRLDGESRNAVQILDLTGMEHVIQRSDIASMSASGLSIMPVGLIDALPDEDIASLIAYLKTSTHPPTE